MLPTKLISSVNAIIFRKIWKQKYFHLSAMKYYKYILYYVAVAASWYEFYNVIDIFYLVLYLQNKTDGILTIDI